MKIASANAVAAPLCRGVRDTAIRQPPDHGYNSATFQRFNAST
jgi:hypothetical protein